MLPAQRMLDEVIASLRNVVAPAVSDPYPKGQAYMAAVILEFLSRSLEERGDVAAEKARAVTALFEDLREICGEALSRGCDADTGEGRVAKLVEALAADRERLGDAAFAAANRRVRQTLRQLLDQDLKIVRGKD